MSIAKRLVSIALLAVACGKPVEPLPPPVTAGGSGTAGGEAGGSAGGGVVVEQGATRASPVTGTLAQLGNPAGFQPLALNRSVKAGTKAGEKTVLTLGVPASAEAAWVALRAKSSVNLTAGGLTFAVAGGGASTWALVPLARGKLELVADADAELSVRGGGWFDQSGAGLQLAAEPALELDLAQGATPLSLPAPSTDQNDDTWGAWLDLTVTGGGADARFELRVCGNEDALEVFDVPASGARSARVLAPRGALCLWASEPLKLKAQVTGRYRRFEKGSMRRATPVTVLDTANGVGWSGLPLKGQALDVDLSGLAGLENARALVLLVDGQLVLHDASKPLVVTAPERQHVKAVLIGKADTREAVPSSCAAWPEEAACAATDLLGRLNCLPGVLAVPRPPPAMEPAAQQFLLQIEQPVDHARPDGETFEQRVLLTFVGENAPTVLHHTGYTLFTYRSDLGRHLSANELEVEHRYFGTSLPASRDFTKLDIVQSALDSHHIVELLRPLLKGKWLGTGHSKGGMTTTYHRRFFPCDTDASVPYVTPLSYSLSDPRYGTWLQNLGGPPLAACRQVFRDIDRGIISNRASFASQLRGTYSKIGSAENALWEMTGMMSWSLFQYGDPLDPQQGCPAYEAIGADPQSLAQLVAYYAQVGEHYSDQSLAQTEADRNFGYIYQMTNELGGQGASREHLVDLGPIPALPEVPRLSLGSVAVPKFEPRAMRDVQDWVKAHGRRMLFLYGELDPWTGGQLELGDAVDSMKLYAPGTNHGVRIDDLTPTDRVAFDATLQRWLGSNGPMLLSAPQPRPMLDTQPQFRDVMRQLRL